MDFELGAVAAAARPPARARAPRPYRQLPER